MSYYTIQVTIPTADNLGENFATNTWHFFADNETVLPTIVAELQTFYISISDRFSSLVRSDNWLFKVYDDVDPEPRAPIWIVEWDTGQTYSLEPLPPEVALCLSFQGDQVSGTPQARKRGRLYIPFLGETQNDPTGRPSAALVSDLANAGAAMLTASNGSLVWEWVTFSRVAPGYSMVTSGWVDNEWDTQRRRGRKATSRTVFS